MMTMHPTTLALDGLVLVSWWKPLLALLLLGGWAWVVSTVYDKDAGRFYLKRRMWNLVHVGAGTAAVACMFSGLLPFAIGLPAMAVILIGDLIAYFLYRNASDQVPPGVKWSTNPADWVEVKKEAKAKKSKQAKGLALVFRGPKGEIPAPKPDAPEFELRLLAEEVVRRGVDLRSSQIEVLPGKEGIYGVVYMVDGVRQSGQQLTGPQGSAVIDFFKSAAGLDVNDRRRRLQGELKVGFGGAASALTPTRVTTMGTSAGQRLTILIDPAKQVTIKVEDLGLLPNQLNDLKKIVEDRKGVVLVSAPPDNGRTTTLYNMLRQHDAYTSNVQTVETDPQAVIEGVRQNVFDAQVDGAEYSTTVRSILRRDPDAVGVAEMPDENTAKEVARADHDHTRVYLGMSADSPLTAIQLYARAVGDQVKAAESLHGVIAQRLARRLCSNCKAPFPPTPDILKKLGLPPEVKQLYRKSGQVMVRDKQQTCPMCGGGGYFGQVGFFAVHPIGKEEQKLIAVNDMTGLRNLFRQKKQPSIQSAGLQHVVLGNTSVEELVRVTQAEAGKPAPAKSAEGVA